MSQLASALWWRDVAERAIAQGWQVLLPLLLLVATTSRIDLAAAGAVGIVAAVQVLLVVLRALSGLRASDAAPWGVQVLDRSVAAAAGSALGIVSAEGFDLLHADARAIALSAAASVLVALGHRWIVLPGQPIEVAGTP